MNADIIKRIVRAIAEGSQTDLDRLALSGASAAMVVKAARDAAKAAILKGKKTVTDAHVREAVAEARRHKRSAQKA